MQKKYPLNISTVPALVLLIVLFTGASCVSKRLAKQAQKQEYAGLYELAAENYLRSYNSNRKNIEAASGLKRTAQITLNSRAELVTQAYLSGNDRETVYKYLDAISYQNRIQNAGINISIPRQALSYYEEAKPGFLEKLFNEARLLLEEESFSRAESIFTEIYEIDPAYKDLSQYIKLSRSEPLYRQGTEQYNSGFYRKAYYTFSNLINHHGAYKDAAVLREDALERGRITIAIAELSNKTRQRNVSKILKNKLVAEISTIDNPFIQVIDDRNLNAFLREQELAERLGSELKIGGLMSARALLTGELSKFIVNEGGLQRTERKAYLKDVVSRIEKETGEKISETKYHKVTYYEYKKESKASGYFRYQLSSTETAAVMISGVVETDQQDHIQYAVFEGNHENLVPGYWEYRSKNSPKDKIVDRKNEIKNLQNLFSARQNIKPAEALRTDLINQIALKVVQDLHTYNPEQ